MPVLNPIQPPLAADLPTNWQPNQIVSPDGVSAGLSQQYGYNYLMEQVNAAQQGVNALGQTINGLPLANEVGGYFQIPQGDNLPSASRQPNSLYGQTIVDYTGAASAASGISIMANGSSRLLGDAPNGTVVKLNVNSQPTNFTVVNQGIPENSPLYDSSCDGTWVTMNDCYIQLNWSNDVEEPYYKSSIINQWLNNAFIKLLDPELQPLIPQVIIPYFDDREGGYCTGNNGLLCQAFLLSLRELGITASDAPNDGAKLEYFESGETTSANSKRIAKYNGSNTTWSTRTPEEKTLRERWIFLIHPEGDSSYGDTNGGGYGIRPTMILPPDWSITSDGFVTPDQPPTAPASIEVTNVVSGGSATIALTAATDPDGTVASYVYERSVDGGQFVQFANINSLTQTDGVQEGWGTVAYRAAAIDDKGIQGPYVTSETYTVNTGWVIVGGPVSNLGVQDAPFVLPLVVNITGGSGVTDINLQVLVDGAQIFNDQLNQGASVALPIDTRAMASGQHEIQAIATKVDYLSANLAWYFVVPSYALPDGGYSAQLEDDSGNPIFPTTTSRDVIGPNGKSVQTEIDQINASHRGITGHLQFLDAILGPNPDYVLPRKADTTYACQLFAPAAADTSSNALVSVYAGYTGSIGSVLTATADSLTFNVPANAILSLYQYVLDAVLPAETDPTVNFTTLAQPKVVTAATNTGNTVTDLNAALKAMMAAFPSQNYYAIVDAQDASTTYYVASQATISQNTTSASVAYVSSAAPTVWYQGVQMTFINTSNIASLFTYLNPPAVASITSANSVSAGTTLNDTLIAMIKAQPTYYRYQLENNSGTLYYVLSPNQLTADSMTASNVLYCTTGGTYYNGETIKFVPAEFPDPASLALGNTISWAGQSWVVSNVDDTECYLTLSGLSGNSIFTNLQSTCQSWQSSNLNAAQLACLKSITAGNTSGEVFVATKDQMNGGLAWFNSDSRRAEGINNVYWTSSAYNDDEAWYVDQGGIGSIGSLVFGYGSNPQGFRPSVCLDMTLSG